jgi:uncharacterized membrane protein YbhN (UPF0104 family)
MLLQTDGTLPPRFVHRVVKGVVKVLAETPPLAQTIIRGVGRSRISAAVSLVIVVVAAATLYHLLRGIQIDRVIEALGAQSTRNILIAALLVAAGYSNLVLYDVFALYSIGRRKIPCRVVAFASFTSYTIGHSLGAATLTCGLVRFRIYSFWGLTVIDIAKIAFMTGLTYWLGNAVVLGGAVAIAPAALTAVDDLPLSINRLLGSAGLAAVGCYLLWLALQPRTVGRADWKIVLPNVRRTLLQVAIGTTDRLLASLSIFMLLPASPSISFVHLVVIFVLATLLGTVSHTPGSLGVVEAAILIGLPQYPREELLASLLTFRVIDFFLPLLLAMIMFGLRELRLIARRTQARRFDSSVQCSPHIGQSPCGRAVPISRA